MRPAHCRTLSTRYSKAGGGGDSTILVAVTLKKNRPKSLFVYVLLQKSIVDIWKFSELYQRQREKKGGREKGRERGKEGGTHFFLK